MTLSEYELRDTALRHQRGDFSIQFPMTTLDFHFILHVDIVCSKAAHIRALEYQPSFTRVRRDQPGT